MVASPINTPEAPCFKRADKMRWILRSHQLAGKKRTEIRWSAVVFILVIVDGCIQFGMGAIDTLLFSSQRIGRSLADV